MKQCEICNIICANHGVYANHKRWHHSSKPLQKQKCNFCSKEIANCSIEKHKRLCYKNPKNIKYCIYCKTIISGYKKKYCNSSCFAKHNNTTRKNVSRDYITPEWKEKRRQTTIEQWKRGVHKISREIFSSKNERAIVKHIKEQYPNDEWKNGGRLVLKDGTFLARDLWSDKLKVCFEYDGIWHFKDIKGQLKKKQTKDKLLEEWCKENNYRLIRIDEEDYQNVKQIEDLIYNSKEQIIKVGNRY